MAELIKAGTYRARATEGRFGFTNTGKEQVAVRFQFLDFEGGITWYGYFTEKTQETTFKALRTAGLRGSDLSDLSDLSREDAPEVHLVIEHEADQQGTPRARVRWVNAPGSGGVALKNQMPEDKVKAFAAKMRGPLAAFDKSNGGTPKPPAPAKPAPAKAAPAPAAADPEHDPDRLEERAQEEAASNAEPLPF